MSAIASVRSMARWRRRARPAMSPADRSAREPLRRCGFSESARWWRPARRRSIASPEESDRRRSYSNSRNDPRASSAGGRADPHAPCEIEHRCRLPNQRGDRRLRRASARRSIDARVVLRATRRDDVDLRSQRQKSCADGFGQWVVARLWRFGARGCREHHNEQGGGKASHGDRSIGHSDLDEQQPVLSAS